MKFYLRALLFAVLFLVTSYIGPAHDVSTFLSFAQSNSCDVTLTSGDSIQAAVDDAASGDVICLAAGQFAENVFIVKGITLRGAGRDGNGQWLTSIIGVRAGTQVVDVFNSGNQIEFNISDLEILDAPQLNDQQLCATEDQSLCPDGLVLSGDIVSQISNIHIAGHADDGFSMFGSTVSIVDSLIEDNSDTGIFEHGYTSFGPSTLSLRNVQVTRNGTDGFIIIGPGELIGENSIFSENGDDGFAVIADSNQFVRLSNSEIFNNAGDGIFIQNEGDELSIESNNIASNGACGIRAIFASNVQGSDNAMHANSGADLCGNLDAGLRIPIASQSIESNIAYPGDYESIQAAIDAVAPGGRIQISEGEFVGSVTVWKPVELEGRGNESIIRGMIALIGSARDIVIRDLSVMDSPVDGMLVHGDANLRLENGTISRSNVHGISVWDQSQVEIVSSQIVNNGANPACDFSCHGIFLNDRSQISITDSALVNNNGWGVAGRLVKCGYGADDFTGSVSQANNTASANGAGDFCLP